MRARSLFVPLVFVLACNRAPQEPAPSSSARAQELVVPPAASTAAPPVVTSAEASAMRPMAGVCPRDPEPTAPMPTTTLRFREGVTLTVELALTEDQRERGLMYRTSMPEDRGMLFAMPSREEHRFWMHNTCISLDMLFIDDDGSIVGILESVPTLNDESREVGRPSRYVLETNAGWTRRHGVRAGQRLTLPRL